jgi:hypothetical protein
MDELLTSRKHSTKRFIPWFIQALFLLVGLVQIWNLANDYVIPFGNRVWKLKGRSALDRSAIIQVGDEFSEYMDFVRNTVPEDSKVIVPPRRPIQTISHIGFVEYFLLPREIHNCAEGEVRECVLRMTGEHSYILVGGEFPPQELAEQVKEFLPFKDGLGIYIPK